jgi:hypothetical protein
MYEAYKYVMEETGKKIACLLNTSVTRGGKKYRDILKEEEVKDRNFVARVDMLPDDLEVAKLEAMMNNAITANPQMILYIDPFKITRMARENVQLAELYFRQAQKKFIKAEQENAATNSEQNAQIQQASIQAKSQSDFILLDKQTYSKQKEILLQGMIDLAKVNIPVPAELQPLINELLVNVQIPLTAQNDQMEQAAVNVEQQMQQQQKQQTQGQEMALEQQ